MKKAGFIFCLFFLIQFSSQAQSKMLLYSPECMQQFEYQVNQESNGNFYVGSSQFFMVENDQGERFYFEIAQKPQQSMPEMPPSAMRCNEIALDELLVRQINNRTLALYLLIPEGENISNYPVVSAVYMNDTDSKITFVSDEMEFDYIIGESNPRKNIARKGTNAVVKFESKNMAVCPPQYTFRVKSRKNRDTRHQTITLTSDVGIFKYNYARRKKELGYNGEELVSVDGFNMDRYLDAVCNGYLDILKKEKIDKIRKEEEEQNETPSPAEEFFSDTTQTVVTYPTVPETNTQPTTTTYPPVNTYPNDLIADTTQTGEVVYYQPVPYNEPIKNEAGGKVTTAQPNTTIVSGGQMPVRPTPDAPLRTGSDPNSSVVTTQPTEVYTQPATTQPATTITSSTEYTTVNPNNRNPQIIPSPDDECGDIYKDLDKGLYFNVSTGKLANTSCGGVTYVNGVITRNPARSVTDVTRYTYNPDNNVPKVNEKPVDYTSVYGEPALVTSSECRMTSDSKYHVVQSGETLYRIASYYNISVNDLKSLNNLKGNTIKKCQRLVYNSSGTGQPYSTYTSAATPKTTYNTSYVSGQSTHTVRRGETLYRIAKMYGMDVSTLKAVNGLSSNEISVGQSLIVNASYSKPVSTTSKGYVAPAGSKIHVVKKGETLYRIAKMYNTSVNNIKSRNGLSGNTISTGQSLVIE